MILSSFRKSRFVPLLTALLALTFFGFSVPSTRAEEKTTYDQVKDAEDAAGTAKDVLETSADLAEELEELMNNSKMGEWAKRAGKYAKVLDAILKVVKAGRLSIEGVRALRDGDRDAFIKVFNEIARDAATTAGAAGGTAAGGAGGTFAFPGLGTLIGGVLGGYLGDKAAGWIYDTFLQDIIKEIGGDLFDTLTGSTPGTGLPTPGDKDGDKDKGPPKLESFGT